MKKYRRIRDLREDSDLYQKDIAKMLNCSQQTYSDYECGRLDIPTEVLVKLANYYNTTTDYLLERTDIPHNAKDIATLSATMLTLPMAKTLAAHQGTMLTPPVIDAFLKKLCKQKRNPAAISKAPPNQKKIPAGKAGSGSKQD